MTLVEMQDVAEARSKSWWLLSRFYLERPQTDFLRSLAKALAELPEDSAEMTALRKAVGDDSEARSLELQREYTRLFRGIKKGYGPPPPYESIYREGSMLGTCVTDVMRSYRDAGFDQIAPEGGPCDHLGSELRFLSLLCLGEMEAWAGEDVAGAMERMSRQAEFLDQHLLAWLPAYAERIGQESRDPFYKAAVQLTLFTARAEREHLEEMARHGESDTELRAAVARSA